jgi:hypothetical protein
MIWDLISGLVPNLWGYLIAAGTALLGVLGIYIKGRRDAKAKADMRDLKANSKTIEEVLRETPSDDPADAIRQRMSDRARKP